MTQQDPLYREIILDHWRNPRNFGMLTNADFDEEEANSTCGDAIRITARLKNGMLESLQFTGTGCAIAIAATSIFSEILAGKRIEVITNMTVEMFLNELGIDISPARLSCALLSYKIIQKLPKQHEQKKIAG